MPGPVSDTYDPEFGTSENAEYVRTAVTGVRDKLAAPMDAKLRDIVELAREGPHGKQRSVTLTENEWRVVRFGLNRALESI